MLNESSPDPAPGRSVTTDGAVAPALGHDLEKHDLEKVGELSRLMADARYLPTLLTLVRPGRAGGFGGDWDATVAALHERGLLQRGPEGQIVVRPELARILTAAAHIGDDAGAGGDGPGSVPL